jgi:hypothetical protein
MSDRGYGYYPEEEGGLYTAGLLTGSGLKSFRKGKPKKGEPSVTVPSLTWSIKRLQRSGRGEKLKNSKWWGFMQAALEDARAKYLASMSPDEKDRYLENQKKQLEAKERKKAKMVLVRDALEELKGNTKEETAKNIAEALKMEGNPNTRILRSAMGILYPELKKNRDNKGGYPDLKPYKFKGVVTLPRKKYKTKSYIGFEKPIKVDEKAIDDEIDRLKTIIEKLQVAKAKAKASTEETSKPKTKTIIVAKK